MSKQVKKKNQLAQQPTFQKYTEKPVEFVGQFLLKNMGYSQERGIGQKKQNALLKPLQLKPRPKGLGLGAKPQNYIQQKQQYSVGDYVEVLKQPHSGMLGRVKIVNDDLMTIEFQVSGVGIKINKDKVKKLSKQEFEEKKETLKDNHQKKEKKLKRLKWIIPNIKIKVISQTSKFYLKKVFVTELISERQFECLQIDEQGNKTYIRDLREKDVQSVIPKIGQTVLLLDKEYKGQKAKLLERNKSKGEVVVQNLSQLNIIKLKQDLVSQFVDF